MKRRFLQTIPCQTCRFFSDNSGEMFKYRPNLAIHRAKVKGTKAEDIIRNVNRVPVPTMKGEALFGPHSVLAALMGTKRKPYVLYIKESVRARSDSNQTIGRILETAESRDVPIRSLTHDQLDRLTEFQLHNGVLLDCTALPFTPLEQMSTDGCFVFLDRVMDTGNIGAIARTAEFFGVHGLAYAQSRGPRSITPSMSKASAGALESLPVFAPTDYVEFFEKCRSMNAFILGTADPESRINQSRASIEISSFRPPPGRPIVLVMGDESRGISDEVVAYCNEFITIGTSSSKNVSSLNVSVAAGILLHRLWALSSSKNLVK